MAGLSFAMRAHLASAVATPLVVSACSSGGDPSSRSSGVPPERVGSMLVCTGNANVIGSGGLYYPLVPDGVDHVGRAGSVLRLRSGCPTGRAPTGAPATGGRLIDGIYLVRPDPELGQDCQTAATRHGHTIACPTLVPAPSSSTSVFASTPSEVLLEGLFSAPVPYVGSGESGRGSNRRTVGHLWIGTARPGSALSCTDPRDADITSVRGHDGTWFECPEQAAGIHAGHVVLVWVEGGNEHLVSLHGLTELNRQLILAIADRLNLVS